MNCGKSMIVQAQVTHEEDVTFPYKFTWTDEDVALLGIGKCNSDAIGLSFPMKFKMPPSKSEGDAPTAKDVQIADALASKEIQDDYIAKLDAPLTNVEQMLRMVFKFMYEWLIMYALRIKNTYLIGNIILQDTESYAKTREQLDNLEIEIVNDARKRMVEGDDGWFNEALVKEGDLPKGIVERRWNARAPWVKDLVFKKEKLNVRDVKWWRERDAQFRSKEAEALAQQKLPNVSLLPVAPAQAFSTEAPKEEENVESTLAKVDVMASPEEFQKQASEFSGVKDAALAAELEKLKESQSEIAALLKEQQEEKQKESKATEAEMEREKKDNTLMRTKFGVVSDLFRKFDAVGRFGGNLAASGSSKLIANGTIKTMLHWLSSIPVEKIFNLTYIRHYIDEAIFHPLGLHKGSFVYRVVNGLLKKMWFVMEPFVKGFSKMTLIVTDVIRKFMEKYGSSPIMALANAQNWYAFVFNWYVKVIYIFSSYFFSLWFAIWWWCIKIVIGVVRFILNLVLSRFGISI